MEMDSKTQATIDRFSERQAKRPDHLVLSGPGGKQIVDRTDEVMVKMVQVQRAAAFADYMRHVFLERRAREMTDAGLTPLDVLRTRLMDTVSIPALTAAMA